MALQNLVDQLLCLSDVIEDKRSFHFAAHQHLLSASKSTNFLSEIVLANLVKPNFFNQEHYPHPSFPIFRNPSFELVANCWIPYSDKGLEISTKSLHHHGDMLLSTITIFGAGYNHWLFKPCSISSDVDHLYNLELIDFSRHSLNHIAFVDSHFIHVPMYPNELSITLALWTSSTTTTRLDKIKAKPFISKNTKLFRNIISSLGLSSFFKVKSLSNLDFYPIEGGFKLIPDRRLTEYSRGPIEHRIQTIFSILQSIFGSTIFDLIDLHSIVLQDLKDNPSQLKFALELLQSLRDEIPIPPILTPDLHIGKQYSNFTTHQVFNSLNKP